MEHMYNIYNHTKTWKTATILEIKLELSSQEISEVNITGDSKK